MLHRILLVVSLTLSAYPALGASDCESASGFCAEDSFQNARRSSRENVRDVERDRRPVEHTRRR